MSEINPNVPPDPLSPAPGPLTVPITACPPPLPGPAPVPVQSLGYSLPMMRQGRPGIITAIAVMSIVVACLSSVASLISGCSAGGIYMASKASKVMSKTTVVTPAPTVATGAATTLPAQTSDSAVAAEPTAPAIVNNPGSDVEIPSHLTFTTGPYGLGEKDRKVVISTLALMQPMSAERRTQLESLLADHGMRVFPTGGNALTPSRVQTSVSSSETHGGESDEDPGYCTFVTAWGTLKVYDAKALFTPADGSAAVSATASSTSDSTSGLPVAIAPNTSGSTTLTALEIQGIVQRSQQASGGRLTAVQLAGLTTALQDPNQTLIAPGTAWSPVRSANVNPDGSAWIGFSGGFVGIDPKGQITATPFGPTPVFNVSSTACGLSALHAGLNLLLAIYLFIGGVIFLRQSPSGRRLHLIYAGIKIPLTIGGTIVLGWMTQEFYASIPGGAGIQNMVVIWMVFLGIVGLIYPVALVIALNTQSIRNYYNAAGG